MSKSVEFCNQLGAEALQRATSRAALNSIGYVSPDPLHLSYSTRDEVDNVPRHHNHSINWSASPCIINCL